MGQESDSEEGLEGDHSSLPPKKQRWENSIILGFTLRKEQNQVGKPESCAWSSLADETIYLSAHGLHILTEELGTGMALREKGNRGQFWASLCSLCPIGASSPKPTLPYLGPGQSIAEAQILKFSPRNVRKD